MIPRFTKKGCLSKGVHLCSGEEFVSRFFFNSYRTSLRKSFTDILDWAKDKGARDVFVGGSFVTNAESPNDIDCLIVFYDETLIPHKSELVTVLSTRIDIQFAAESDREIVDMFVHLFTHTRINEEVGVVQINLNYADKAWKIQHQPDGTTYEIIKRAYIDRHFVDHYEPNGLLVTIHGLLSTAKWNSEVAPIASSQNWIFAPYIYEHNGPSLLFDSKGRRALVNDFREWLYDQFRRYESPVSIIAHSFGTYILASYISGFEESLPVKLNVVILTGSIINPEFDWDKCKGAKLARVRNEVAPNDQWVKHMPKVKWIDSDPLYGNSGVVGFTKKSSILFEARNEIFDHNNVIKRDILEQHWFPFLMVNRNAYWEESNEYIFSKYNAKPKSKQ